jgi:hypothetical protein
VNQWRLSWPALSAVSRDKDGAAVAGGDVMIGAEILAANERSKCGADHSASSGCAARPGLATMADRLIEPQNDPQAAKMPHADWLGSAHRSRGHFFATTFASRTDWQPPSSVRPPPSRTSAI